MTPDEKEIPFSTLETLSQLLSPRCAVDCTQDTAGDKALRAVDGAIYVAKVAPLGTAIKASRTFRSLPSNALIERTDGAVLRPLLAQNAAPS